MATDSFFNDLDEPRLLRPLPNNMLSDKLQAQVSEPSLFSADLSFKPRAKVLQVSPLKNPGFIPQFTPLPPPKKVHGKACKHCDCKTPLTESGGDPSSAPPASPSLDPEIKEFIENQSKQLQLLRKQVEQLLRYQEGLCEKKEERERAHEATQTTFMESPVAAVDSPRPPHCRRKSSSVSPQNRPSSDRTTEFSLTFRDLQLQTIVEQPPSPQPSIVVNMQDYQPSLLEFSGPSLDGSNSDVMEHVKKLLAQANIAGNNAKDLAVEQKHADHNPIRPENPVRKVTIQRVQEMGISFIHPPNSTSNRKSGPLLPASKVRKETDQSVEMERLAAKYLGQTGSYQPQVANRFLHGRTSRSVEMSMSSQQYLERYGLQEEYQFPSS